MLDSESETPSAAIEGSYVDKCPLPETFRFVDASYQKVGHLNQDEAHRIVRQDCALHYQVPSFPKRHTNIAAAAPAFAVRKRYRPPDPSYQTVRFNICRRVNVSENRFRVF
jgi:hypothetical protein